MKKIVVALSLICFFIAANAQKIIWKYSAKKIADNKYELHIMATPPAGWHIYSQTTPDGGPIPTSFKFNKNALITVVGKPKESGKLISYFDKNFKVNVKYFDGKVDFVEMVTLKSKIKTNITGEIESMICNDKQCLPPSTEKFSIALQ